MEDKSQENDQNTNGSMPILDHLKELRTRLIRSAIYLAIAFVFSFAFSKELLQYLSKPLEDSLAKNDAKIHIQENNRQTGDYNCSCTKDSDLAQNDNGGLVCHCKAGAQVKEKKSSFVFLNLTEVFIAKINIAFWASLFLAMPFLLAELWGFIAPAMYKPEKKIFFTILVGSIVCFAGGALFCFYFVFPNAFEFFISLSDNLALPTISLANYLDFSLMMIFVFGIVFELPVVCFILAFFNIINAPFMIKHIRLVVIIITVIAAIFTPPDPLSMMLMAVPLVGLYLLSYLLVGITKGFRVKEQA